MSAEAISQSNGSEFRARPIQTTERGTEVAPSKTGNRILDAANRVVGFLDRLKVGRQEARENVQDAGQQFVRKTGEIATMTLDIGIGVAAFGVEATVRGGKKAGEWLEAKNEALQGKIDEGVDKAIDWTTGKVDAVKQTATETAGYVKEGILGGIDYAKQKGTDTKETALDRVEAVKSFFKEKAEAAKTRRDARREQWSARITRGKEAASAAALRGKEIASDTVEKGREFRAKAQKRGHAVRIAAQAAQIVYSANVRS